MLLILNAATAEAELCLICVFKTFPANKQQNYQTGTKSSVTHRRSLKNPFKFLYRHCIKAL